MCKLEGLKSKLTECLEDLPGLLTSVTLFFFFFFFSPYFNLLAAEVTRATDSQTFVMLNIPGGNIKIFPWAFVLVHKISVHWLQGKEICYRSRLNSGSGNCDHEILSEDSCNTSRVLCILSQSLVIILELFIDNSRGNRHLKKTWLILLLTWLF